jgi:hypothetical protein
MKELKLTQGKVALVDDEDYESLNQWRWHVQISSSKYLGVHFCNSRKVWVAQLQHDGKSYSAGLHKLENDAALAYNKKAKQLHGEFANLNQIQ